MLSIMEKQFIALWARLNIDSLEFQIRLYMCFESFCPDWLLSTAVGAYFVSQGYLFSKTQRKKVKNVITSVFFQALHEHNYFK